MTSPLRTHAHTGALSVPTATALAAALAAVPAAAATVGTSATTTSTLSRPAGPSQRTVTLLTGDRVVLRHDATGRTIASMTPGSPHYGRPVDFVDAGTHTWVVPKLAPAVRRPASTPPSSTSPRWPDGCRSRSPSRRCPRARPARPPGADVVRAQRRRRTHHGHRVVRRASAAARPPRSVALRRLPHLAGGRHDGAAQLAPPYELHTLTLNATTGKGPPLPGADVFVINTDDARLFGTFGAIIDGQWKVSVPTGNYLILTDDFRHVVVKSASVTDDTIASLSMADATVKPKLTLPGHKTLSPSLDLIGSDEWRRSVLDFGFGGFFPRVSPLRPWSPAASTPRSPTCGPPRATASSPSTATSDDPPDQAGRWPPRRS